MSNLNFDTSKFKESQVLIFCPVFNEAIQDGKKVKTFDIENMWGLGTPEDLDFFLKNN